MKQKKRARKWAKKARRYRLTQQIGRLEHLMELQANNVRVLHDAMVKIIKGEPVTLGPHNITTMAVGLKTSSGSSDRPNCRPLWVERLAVPSGKAKGTAGDRNSRGRQRPRLTTRSGESK